MIVVNVGPGAMDHVRRGYLNALRHMGYQCEYISHEDPKYPDYLNQLKPTHIIGATWEVAPWTDLLVKLRPKMILRASEWSPKAQEIGPPLCLVTQQEKDSVKTLVHHGLLDSVNTYYTDTFLAQMLGGWTELTQIKSSLLAADTTEYYPVVTPKLYDFSFVGGWWAYKAIYLKWIGGLSDLFNGLIYGGSTWPYAAYRGPCSTPLANRLFNQSYTCPNVMEPLAVDYHFDVNERTYKTCAAGAFSLIQHNHSAEEIFGDNVEYFVSEGELIEKTGFYLNHPDSAEKIALKGYEHVINHHTYLHRVKEFV